VRQIGQEWVTFWACEMFPRQDRIQGKQNGWSQSIFEKTKKKSMKKI